MGKGAFDSAFCTALLRYFWICYRHGMEDACRSGDIGECEEAIVRLRDLKNFGIVGLEMDWNEWQFKTLQWTREDACRIRVMELLMSLRSPRHSLAFLLQIAKMYYLTGISDWMECSDWLTIDIVRAMSNYPYLLKRKHTFRPSKGMERFEFLQGVCFNLIELHEVFGDTSGVYDVVPSRLRMFVERVWSVKQRSRWFDDYDVEEDAWDAVSQRVVLDEGLVSEDNTKQVKRRRTKNGGKD